jgi:hypothetical protein
MSERRQVHRREPIIIELDGGREFEARPLPWLKRNELGNEVVSQGVSRVNEFVRMYVEETDVGKVIPQLEMTFVDRLSDYPKILRMAYPQYEDSLFDDLSFEEILELIGAALEVNKLEPLRPLIDPNSPSPIETGLSEPSIGVVAEDGPKMESTADSSLPVLTDTSSKI